MKWKGTVSHSENTSIAARFAMANANHAPSTQVKRRVGQSRSAAIDPIALTPHGFHDVCAELRAETPHVHVDDVGAGIEVVAPDAREKPLLRDRLAGMLEQLLQKEELALGERLAAPADARLPPDEVEREPARRDAGRR